jgi:hypothetical protein
MRWDSCIGLRFDQLFCEDMRCSADLSDPFSTALFEIRIGLTKQAEPPSRFKLPSKIWTNLKGLAFPQTTRESLQNPANA